MSQLKEGQRWRERWREKARYVVRIFDDHVFYKPLGEGVSGDQIRGIKIRSFRAWARQSGASA